MRIYLSPSRQPRNIYAGQTVSEQTMCGRYAQACKAALEAAGHQVGLNISASLSGRIAEANRWGADLYVPIHTNAGGGKGVEVLTSGNGRVDAYARSICAELAVVIPSRTDRGLKPTAPGRPGAVEIYGANAPVAYVEAEFHDDATCAAWLVANPDAVGQAIARGIVKIAGGSVPGGAPPAPTQEDIVATKEELAAIIDARTRRPWYRVTGTRLAWEDLGTARRAGSDRLYQAMGSPPIVDLDLTDSFWRLVPVVDPLYREAYRKVGGEAVWYLDVVDGALVRRWADRDRYTAAGSPDVMDLAVAHPVWSLPTAGELPPEGR